LNLTKSLLQNQNEIIRETCSSLLRSNLKHYSALDSEANREKIKRLFDLTLKSIKEKSLIEMIEYSEKIAAERFKAGYDLHEVHTAYNVLEEEIWKFILRDLDPNDYGNALGLVSTILGTGKETLALTFISLKGKVRAESLDLSELFKGN
jgi:hypothetical protein